MELRAIVLTCVFGAHISTDVLHVLGFLFIYFFFFLIVNPCHCHLLCMKLNFSKSFNNENKKKNITSSWCVSLLYDSTAYRLIREKCKNRLCKSYTDNMLSLPASQPAWLKKKNNIICITRNKTKYFLNVLLWFFESYAAMTIERVCNAV